MKTRTSLLLGALAAAGALSLAPLIAEAGPGGGGGGGGSGHKGGGGGGHHGGYHGGGHHGGHGYGYRGGYGHRGGYYGGYRGWYSGGWGYRGYYPSYYWGGVGLGVATVAYSAPYYGYYGGYYSHPAAPVAQYIVAEPAAGDRVVRSGQPVPASAPPEPIFYPRNGQTPAQTEADRQDCNRWATTQAGALSDASVFQRATYACMEGRGYTVR